MPFFASWRKRWDCRKRDLSLAHGAADRRKLVHVAGDAARLMPRLEQALAPWLKPA